VAEAEAANGKAEVPDGAAGGELSSILLAVLAGTEEDAAVNPRKGLNCDSVTPFRPPSGKAAAAVAFDDEAAAACDWNCGC